MSVMLAVEVDRRFDGRKAHRLFRTVQNSRWHLQRIRRTQFHADRLPMRIRRTMTQSKHQTGLTSPPDNAGSPVRFQEIIIGAIMVLVGSATIWLGPIVSGWGALHGAWCGEASGPLSSQLSHYAWLATQHCPYCYMGAALMVGGFWLLSPLRLATNRAAFIANPTR